MKRYSPKPDGDARRDVVAGVIEHIGDAARNVAPDGDTFSKDDFVTYMVNVAYPQNQDKQREVANSIKPDIVDSVAENLALERLLAEGEVTPGLMDWIVGADNPLAKSIPIASVKSPEENIVDKTTLKNFLDGQDTNARIPIVNRILATDMAAARKAVAVKLRVLIVDLYHKVLQCHACIIKLQFLWFKFSIQNSVLSTRLHCFRQRRFILIILFFFLKVVPSGESPASIEPPAPIEEPLHEQLETVTEVVDDTVAEHIDTTPASPKRMPGAEAIAVPILHISNEVSKSVCK